MYNWRCTVLIVSGLALVVSSTNNDTDCKDVHNIKGPLIIPCVNEIILQKGQNFEFICRGNTTLDFKQQELSEDVTQSDFKKVVKTRTLYNDKYTNEIALNLYNVDQYAIGYYACIDTLMDGKTLFNNLIEEPNNTEHATYIYIYVNGTGSVFAPMSEIVTAKSNMFVLECRPTTPDIVITLAPVTAAITYKRYSPKIGYVLDRGDLGEKLSYVMITCVFEKRQKINENDEPVKQDIIVRLPIGNVKKPFIKGDSEKFLAGETFSLNCTAEYVMNEPVHLTWIYPTDTITNTIKVLTNNDYALGGILYRNITIYNATKDHAGTYVCVSQNNCYNATATFNKKFLDKPKLLLDKMNKDKIIEAKQRLLRLMVRVDAYPPANITIFKDGIQIPENMADKYSYSWNKLLHGTLQIKNMSVRDTGNYTWYASNGYINDSVNFDVRYSAKPSIDLGTQHKSCVYQMNANFECRVTGYPLPEITWIFADDNSKSMTMKPTTLKVLSLYEEIAYLNIPSCQPTSGNISCKASNSEGETVTTKRLIVYEMATGFGIDGDRVQPYAENQNVAIKCLASKYDFTNVSWYRDGDELIDEVQQSENELSLVAELKIDYIPLNYSGRYECLGVKNDGTVRNDSIDITVVALQPLIVEPSADLFKEAYPFEPVKFNCKAQGVPLPTIQWFKDGEPFLNVSRNCSLFTCDSNVEIKTPHEHTGIYECYITSGAYQQKRTFELAVRVEEATNIIPIAIPIGVIFFVFTLLVAYLTWKNRKHKQFKKELAAAGLGDFKKGKIKSLNPDLGIDEQAELLPYDERFEFPAEKLSIGKQLGAGAFGVVYKAEARGIINAEEATPVAVKMVKKTADNMYIKALASELKIMVHLGKHINIVNLLGACTKNVVKRELMVIVEYCKFGNIHSYLQRHRTVFIDQLTDNKEKTLGKINRGFSASSTGSTGAQSDYFGSANTQETDHTFLNTANTNRYGRKNVPTTNTPMEVVKVSEGYVQPEWRSNYESDYVYDGHTPRPLTSRDLLAWAFQIARGMEYLASRKVLHGDLAARNVLLADDNVVKICDFGLAKSIYKNDEYQKKENSPLPVKWLAIECMTDRIFSTQSDVWSFGIVLWELFTLAKTPYPNISPASLLQFLMEGNRLDKPQYADDRLYKLMNDCWEQKPTMRPSFSQLQETLGTFLEDSVRNHYLDLNAEYVDTNIKMSGPEDYLAMVSTPDYNNLVTPSPHHYVNDANRNFFPPTPTKVDDEGYLQMCGNTGTKFDFDPRKFNQRASDPSTIGSELTPMLSLNNVPTRSGSESDQESNAPSYLKMCPTIEETDEVFETKLNNAKNSQNTAVTNPTYITFDIEKKPADIHNYTNIVSNGLVK